VSVKWTEQGERSNPFTLKLICWIALHTSRSMARAWLYPITLYFFITSPRVRFSCKKYLKRALSHGANSWHSLKHIHHFASTILDRVYFLTGKRNKFQIQIEGQQLLEQHLASGKGCILLGSHLGSFEVLRCLAINREQLRLKILMYRDHNQMITHILHSLNPKVAASVIDLADEFAMFQVKECLDQGWMVGMLGDRIAEKDKSVMVKLLNSEVAFPTGPMQLAGVLSVPVILFFGLYLGSNRYKICFEELAVNISSERNKRAESVAYWTQQYANRIEYYMREYPYNWFNFYDYWKDEETV